MLTALSVARECHMVKLDDHVILCQAFPPQTDKNGENLADAKTEYIYIDQIGDAIPKNSKSYNVSVYYFIAF